MVIVFAPYVIQHLDAREAIGGSLGFVPYEEACMTDGINFLDTNGESNNHHQFCKETKHLILIGVIFFSRFVKVVVGRVWIVFV